MRRDALRRKMRFEERARALESEREERYKAGRQRRPPRQRPGPRPRQPPSEGPTSWQVVDTDRVETPCAAPSAHHSMGLSANQEADISAHDSSNRVRAKMDVSEAKGGAPKGIHPDLRFSTTLGKSHNNDESENPALPMHGSHHFTPAVPIAPTDAPAFGGPKGGPARRIPNSSEGEDRCEDTDSACQLSSSSSASKKARQHWSETQAEPANPFGGGSYLFH